MRRPACPLLCLGLALGCAGAPTPPPAPAPPRPVRPAPPPAPPLPLRLLRVKVYASQGYVAQTEGWQVQVYRAARIANRAAEDVGLRLKLVTLTEWEGAAPESLGAAVEALERLDPGRPGELIVGLLPPLDHLSRDLSELSNGRLLGRHLVLRGSDPGLEYAALRGSLRRLPEAQQAQLVRERRLHRVAALLLHGLGRVLAGVHTNDPGALLGRQYHREMSRFTAGNAALIRLASAALFQAPGPQDGLRRKLVARLEAARWPGWSEAAVGRMVRHLVNPQPALTELVAAAEPLADPPAEEAPAPAPGGSPVDPRPALAQLAEDPAAAERALAPLLAQAPDDPEVVGAACLIGRAQAAQAQPPLAVRAARCERAAQRFPSDASYRLALAQLKAQAEDRPAAIKELRAAHGLLQLEGKPAAESWAFLAQLYQQLDLVSWAEAAAAQAGEAGAVVRDWAQQARQAFDLPEDAAARGLKPQAEPDYVAARRALNQALRQRALAPAQRAAAQLAKRYPGLPAPSLELCQLNAHHKRYRAAIRHCQAALQQPPQRLQAQVLLAYIEMNRRRPRAAVPWLKQALAAAPGRKDLWQLLGSAYRLSGDRAAHDALAASYQDRFAQPLPRR